mmetsp:Transcript_57997/g.142264  ORF Transcript_57997/g.142264 Transcript_57997/m.142264 type:complete len:209 (-) Transcript_57997:275-901(-)
MARSTAALGLVLLVEAALGFSPGPLVGRMAVGRAGISGMGRHGVCGLPLRPPGTQAQAPAWGFSGPLRRRGCSTAVQMGEGKEKAIAELEEECEAAICLAEQLWEEALASRQRADELCDQAGLIAERSLGEAETATQELDEVTRFSLKSIAKSSRAVSSSIDSMNAVALAEEENQRANDLEKQAEEALARSEALMHRLAELEGEEEDL